MATRISIPAAVTCLLGGLLAMSLNGCGPANPAALEYRLTEWKTLHLSTKEDADKEVEVLQGRLECEVKRSDHEGHYDVSYRCPKWKVLDLAKDANFQEWEEFLTTRGFETYRLTDAPHTHSHDGEDHGHDEHGHDEHSHDEHGDHQPDHDHDHSHGDHGHSHDAGEGKAGKKVQNAQAAEEGSSETAD